MRSWVAIGLGLEVAWMAAAAFAGDLRFDLDADGAVDIALTSWPTQESLVR